MFRSEAVTCRKCLTPLFSEKILDLYIRHILELFNSTRLLRWAAAQMNFLRGCSRKTTTRTRAGILWTKLTGSPATTSARYANSGVLPYTGLTACTENYWAGQRKDTSPSACHYMKSPWWFPWLTCTCRPQPRYKSHWCFQMGVISSLFISLFHTHPRRYLERRYLERRRPSARNKSFCLLNL